MSNYEIKVIEGKDKGFDMNTILHSEASIVLILVLIGIVASFLSPHFLTVTNIINILQRSSVIGVVSVGMTFVILTGGIDLSVGGQVVLIGSIGAYLMVQDFNFSMCLLLMILLGCIIGMFNGFCISVLRFPPFILTLAMMYITKGTSLYLTQGRTIFGLPEKLNFFGLSRTLGIPNPIWIFLIFFVLGYIVLKYTSFGRKVYAIGDNERAAWLAGVKTREINFAVYVIQGCLAAVGALILISRLQAATGTMGQGLELDAIAAVVIGGTSLFGGEGHITGTFIGALIITIIANVLNLVGISPFLQGVVKGIIIVLAVLLDLWRKNRLAKRVV